MHTCDICPMRTPF